MNRQIADELQSGFMNCRLAITIDCTEQEYLSWLGLRLAQSTGPVLQKFN